ncbi:MAG: hypothetical protein P8169_07125, partial [Chloroflexota bacterium]
METALDMIITQLIKDAMQEFEQIMKVFERQSDLSYLTAELANQFSRTLQQALSQAGRKAFQDFIESYDLAEPNLYHQNRKFRWKQYSVKQFLTPYGVIPIRRSLYQADCGGRAYIPLDHFWGMEGEFVLPDVREAIAFSMAHLTAKETEQFFRKCHWFTPSATAIQHVVARIGETIEKHREELYRNVNQEETVSPEAVSVAVSMDGVNVLLNEPGVGRGRPAERPGKNPSGEKTCYKNAMVGSFTVYGNVPKAKKTPERLDSRYIARMPEDQA